MNIDYWTIAELEAANKEFQAIKDWGNSAKPASDELLNYGICSQLGPLCTDMFDYLVEQWPKYSGNLVFPIPGGYESYTLHRRQNSLWAGEQLNLRLELLQFCIDKIQLYLTNQIQSN